MKKRQIPVWELNWESLNSFNLSGHQKFITLADDVAVVVVVVYFSQ